MALSDDDSRVGCGFLAFWMAAEAATWILLTAVGAAGVVWLIAGSLAIGVAFLMVYAMFRVLRGHELMGDE